MFDPQIMQRINDVAAAKRAAGETVDYRTLIVPVQKPNDKDGPPTIPANVPYPFH